MGQGWQGQLDWRILDTQFAGVRFLETWLAWQQEPQRPRVLHYVALCQAACPLDALEAVVQVRPELSKLAAALACQWWGLLPGFHRFSLDQGQVLLTLCVGPILPMLKAQHFLADAVVLHPAAMPDSGWIWSMKALARCCRRGTVLRLVLGPQVGNSAHEEEFAQGLVRTGFRRVPASVIGSQVDAEHDHDLWLYEPPWQLKVARHTPLNPQPPGRCVVVGAGLAGASVAAALARRGWQVQVLDQDDSQAAGASGLPVGLAVPHVSRDDCMLSRLSRAGVRMTLQQASQMLLKGKDWYPSGVLERQMDDTAQMPDTWATTGLAWSQAIPDASLSTTNCSVGTGIWHSHAAWIKPAELVKAWLAQPNVTFQGGAKAVALRQQDGVWDVLDAAGACLASAGQVVLANASGAFELLYELKQSGHTIQGLKLNLLEIKNMRGLLTWLPDSAAGHVTTRHDFPAFPVNGSGSLIPGIPLAHGTACFMGSSYQDAAEPERSDADNHAINLAHLQQLLPDLAARLGSAFESGRVNAWKGVRCVTADRLPVVGPVQIDGQSGLCICAGMGSRGLSFSVLCAELLAARLGAEPLPLEVKLADALDASRGQSN